jgi:hypothetical protein
MVELRAMFDDMTGMARERFADLRRGYQATDKVTVDFLLVNMATLCSAMVELVDVIRSHEATLALHHAHIENLIERVRALEPFDEMPPVIS